MQAATKTSLGTFTLEYCSRDKFFENKQSFSTAEASALEPADCPWQNDLRRFLEAYLSVCGYMPHQKQVE